MGRTLGAHWETVQKKMADFLVRYILAMAILIALVILFLIFKKKFRKKEE
jgi:membrane protein DedA with SNARE-associated domain